MEMGRNTFYHSFTGLAPRGTYTLKDYGYAGKYFEFTAGTKTVKGRILAEDRSGDMVAKSKAYEFEINP